MTQRGQVRFLVRREILAAGEFTVADVVRRTGLNVASVRTELTRLKKQGLLESSPIVARAPRRGAPLHRYRLIPDRQAEAVLEESTAAFIPAARGSAPAPRMSVFGIGAAGVRALSQLRLDAVFPARLVAVETQARNLLTSAADQKLLVGAARTKGLGVGSDAALARQLALEEEPKLKAALADQDVVFLMAGAGDGAGAGIAPYLASLARRAGALTIGIVTQPFAFEGPRRQGAAERCLAELLDQADTVIPLSHDSLLGHDELTPSAQQTLDLVDRIMAETVASLVYVPMPSGLRPVELEALCTVLRAGGPAIVAIGRGAGRERALKAGRALRHDWLRCGDPALATGVVLAIAGPLDLRVAEVRDLLADVRLLLSDGTDLLFAERLDPQLDDEIRVVVTALGSARPCPAVRTTESARSLIGDEEKHDSTQIGTR